MARNLKLLIDKINILSNKNNIACIQSYYSYLLDKGVSLNTQLNNLQTVLYFARYLGDTKLEDVKERHQVMSYLNTMVKYDDPDKKYISTWNIYMLRLVSFYASVNLTINLWLEDALFQLWLSKETALLT